MKSVAELPIVSRDIFLIRDNVSGGYSPLFLASNLDAAKREFSQFLINVPASPGDYDLYLLGELSGSDAVCPKIISESLPVHVINGLGLRPVTTSLPVKETNNV